MTAEECVEQYRKALNNPVAGDFIKDLSTMQHAVESLSKVQDIPLAAAYAKLRMLCS